MTFAVVRSGGKQTLVEPGQVVDFELIEAQPGDQVQFNDVLLVGGDGPVRYGKPTVEGAHVVGQVLEQRRGPKIIVFKYKPKTRYRKKTGHRQQLTRVSIQEIVA
ncbi:MAG TPA: 50S ribosomal protein L21 [Chloroflexota bacterium]|jgi:large subunit ribosomal protein L21|nr:50S ribosomal protein L21 [Chloroflexota bacterium]